MQQFTVTILVTANTLEDVTTEDIREAVETAMEDYSGGSSEVQSVVEIG